MLYAPDDYLSFRCIASACRHSCCIGWEIDIDDETRAAYAQVGGDFGARLATAIEDGEDGAHFRLGPGERCPMLRADGLCELILTLGEDALCQICADHPRFRSFFTGRTELGLGLCCEAAGAMLLARVEPMRIVPVGDDGEDECLTDDERDLLSLRGELMALAGDASLSLDARTDAILARVGLTEKRSLDEWRTIFAGLERLDGGWDEMLALIGQPTEAVDETPFARLLEYFLYRHLPSALDDGRRAERAAFAVLSVRIIRAIWCAGEQTAARLVEVARMYSSEIEYDEDNVEALLDTLGE